MFQFSFLLWLLQSSRDQETSSLNYCGCNLRKIAKLARSSLAIVPKVFVRTDKLQRNTPFVTLQCYKLAFGKENCFHRSLVIFVLILVVKSSDFFLSSVTSYTPFKTPSTNLPWKTHNSTKPKGDTGKSYFHMCTFSALLGLFCLILHSWIFTSYNARNYGESMCNKDKKPEYWILTLF